MQIAARRVAHLHYTLTNDAGEVLDSSRDRDPLAYLHGNGHIVPGLEKALDGRAPGDRFQVDVPPDEGYGQHQSTLVQNVPKSAFGETPDVRPGMRFRAESSAGPMTVLVTEVAEEQVTVDGNHPLAGKTLHFDVEVTAVREASEEEVLHGHAHGAGGHDHE